MKASPHFDFTPQNKCECINFPGSGSVLNLRILEDMVFVGFYAVLLLHSGEQK